MIFLFYFFTFLLSVFCLIYIFNNFTVILFYTLSFFFSFFLSFLSICCNFSPFYFFLSFSCFYLFHLTFHLFSSNSIWYLFCSFKPISFFLSFFLSFTHLSYSIYFHILFSPIFLNCSLLLHITLLFPLYIFPKTNFSLYFVILSFLSLFSLNLFLSFHFFLQIHLLKLLMLKHCHFSVSILSSVFDFFFSLNVLSLFFFVSYISFIHSFGHQPFAR